MLQKKMKERRVRKVNLLCKDRELKPTVLHWSKRMNHFSRQCTYMPAPTIEFTRLEAVPNKPDLTLGWDTFETWRVIPEEDAPVLSVSGGLMMLGLVDDCGPRICVDLCAGGPWLLGNDYRRPCFL